MSFRRICLKSRAEACKAWSSEDLHQLQPVGSNIDYDCERGFPDPRYVAKTNTVRVKRVLPSGFKSGTGFELYNQQQNDEPDWCDFGYYLASAENVGDNPGLKFSSPIKHGDRLASYGVSGVESGNEEGYVMIQFDEEVVSGKKGGTVVQTDSGFTVGPIAESLESKFSDEDKVHCIARPTFLTSRGAHACQWSPDGRGYGTHTKTNRGNAECLKATEHRVSSGNEVASHAETSTPDFLVDHVEPLLWGSSGGPSIKGKHQNGEWAGIVVGGALKAPEASRFQLEKNKARVTGNKLTYLQQKVDDSRRLLGIVSCSKSPNLEFELPKSLRIEQVEGMIATVQQELAFLAEGDAEGAAGTSLLQTGAGAEVKKQQVEYLSVLLKELQCELATLKPIKGPARTFMVQLLDKQNSTDYRQISIDEKVLAADGKYQFLVDLIRTKFGKEPKNIKYYHPIPDDETLKREWVCMSDDEDFDGALKEQHFDDKTGKTIVTRKIRFFIS